MSLRCRLLGHRWFRRDHLTVQVRPWMKTMTNASCVRCGKRGWVNWIGTSNIERTA